jgi:hypothetical protein
MEATGHGAEAKFTKKRSSNKSILRLPHLEHAKAVAARIVSVSCFKSSTNYFSSPTSSRLAAAGR